MILTIAGFLLTGLVLSDPAESGLLCLSLGNIERRKGPKNSGWTAGRRSPVHSAVSRTMVFIVGVFLSD